MCELGDIHAWLVKDADKVIWGILKISAQVDVLLNTCG